MNGVGLKNLPINPQHLYNSSRLYLLEDSWKCRKNCPWHNLYVFTP